MEFLGNYLFIWLFSILFHIFNFGTLLSVFLGGHDFYCGLVSLVLFLIQDTIATLLQLWWP